MKKYLAYIMMLIKSTWKFFAGFLLIILSWQCISFINKLGNKEPFEKIVDYTGGLYMISILIILFLLYLYRKRTENQKRGLLLPIKCREILISRVLYGLGWALILTAVTIIVIYIEGRIYIAKMPSDLVSEQTIVMGLLNTDFGNLIYGNNLIVQLSQVLLFVSFTILVSLDRTITKNLSNAKIVLMYVLIITVIIIVSVFYVKSANSLYILRIPDLLILILVLNADVLSERIFDPEDR